MFHCHILDHAEVGLMSTVDVGDIHITNDDDSEPPDGKHTH
jgi:hypothetical protein